MITILRDCHRSEGVENVADRLLALEEKAFPDPWKREAFLSSLSAETVTLFTAYEEDTLTGYLLLLTVAPEGEIMNLAVDPDQRRKGTGEALMNEMLSHCRESGIDTLFLEVRESNLAARRLYAKKGFLPVGKRKRYYRFPTEDAVVMMLSLPL